MSSAEKYNPENKTWSPIEDMNYARTRFAIAVIEDRIYVIGGYVDGSSVGSVEYFSDEDKQW
jgi:hypothetical protein